MKIMDILVNEINKNIANGEPKFERLHSEQYEIITTKNGKFHNKVKKQKENKDKTYKAEYFDDSFEIFSFNNDNEALQEAYDMETENNHLINLFEIDEDYNEIRTIF